MQIWGEAVGSDMTMTVMLNGQQVFQGSIPSRDQYSQGDHWVLAQFDFPMDMHGVFPFSLQVTGGNIYYTQTLTNFQGTKYRAAGVSPEATWPLGRPSTDEEILQDSRILSRQQWLDKYGQKYKECLIPEIFLESSVHWRESNFRNTVDNDGRLIVRVANSPRSLDVTARQQRGLMGDWAYLVPENQSLVCELQILPPIVD
jgi:hypothetical protein